MKNKSMKLVLVLLVVNLLLVGCGRRKLDDPKGDEKIVEEDEKLDEVIEDEPYLINEELREVVNKVKDLVREEIELQEYNFIKKIDVNENIGTDDIDDDLIVIVNIQSDIKDASEVIRNKIEKEAVDIITLIKDEANISEIAIFYEVPYIEEGENVAKITYEQGEELEIQYWSNLAIGR